MVIHQFNKLIRNKWVWGVFAVLVSLAFVAPDEWFRGRDDGRSGEDSRNKLSGVPFDAALYGRCEHLVRDFLPNFQRSPIARLFDRTSARDAWKAYAAAIAARDAGYSIPDDVLAGRIKALFSTGEGDFSEAVYADEVRRGFGIEPRTFEDLLRLWMSIEGALDGLAASASWPVPMELDQNIRDYTDRFTVKVATFTEDKAAAAAVKVDDEGLKKWYDANSASIALPDRFRLRYLKFDVDASNVLARVELTEDAVQTRYEENVEKKLYDVPPATTNDVATVKPIEEVRESIEIALRHEGALDIVKNDVKVKMEIDEEDEDAANALLASVSEAEGVPVATSDWFAISGRSVTGFMRPPEALFPGVQRREFDRAVRSLLDYRFAMFASDRAVYLAELAERSEAHTPTFEEAKGAIADRALRDARLEAFKASVEAVAAKGVQAVLDSGSVSTNLTFSPCDFGRDYAFGWTNTYGEWDFKSAGFPNAEKIVFAARSLDRDGVSPFVQISSGKGALVVCVDRKAGDIADFSRGERFARMVSVRSQAVSLYGDWLDWNLARLGYRESPSYADEEADDGDDGE